MPEKFSISIDQVVDLLGLERDQRGRQGASSYNVRCPFCNDTKYHMNINVDKGTYHCVLCMDPSEKHTGTLDLYSRVRFGTRLRKGQNSREIYLKLCDELRIDSGEARERLQKVRRMPVKQEIAPAPDAMLDAAYHKLLHLPCLRLTKDHTANLKKRGLGKKAIILNEYASIPPAGDVIKKYPKASQRARTRIEECGVLKEEQSLELLKRRGIRENELIAGVMAASAILRSGIKLDRVPGFFTLGQAQKLYVFLWEEGMAIPTRNANKEIVGIQVRKDTAMKSGLRYKTLSSKGFPDGVETQIARTHFPLANAAPETCERVILTEGPLKADVALELMKKLGMPPVMFIAVQGVNNTAELPDIAKALKEKGVSEIYNGFDMDRCCNVHVAKACVSVRKKLADCGVQFIPMLWDKEYAIKRAAELKALCEDNHLDWEPAGDPFIDIALMSKVLHNASVEFNYTVVNGVKVKENWNPQTKGIDDFLLLQAAQTPGS